MPAFLQFGTIFLRIVQVLAINFSLFLVIPVSHSLFSMIKTEDKAVVAQKRVVAELVKPKKPKPKKVSKSRIRSVSNSSSQSLNNPMKFKFTPDLSVASGGGGVAIANQELQAEVFEEGEVDQEAIPQLTPPPQYPPRARELAIEGMVIVEFIVGADGTITDIEKITAPHPSFKKTVRQTLMKWKFKPAQNNGIPVNQRMRLPLEFSLDS